MNVLMVHIGDLHLKKNVHIEDDKISKISDALNEYVGKVSNVIIICTGDIANTGSEEEYKTAKYFFNKLIYSLKERFNVNIKVYCVPGNHDIQIDPSESFRQTQITDLNLEKEFLKENNYFKFTSGLYRRHQEPYDIYSKNLRLVRINMINTAPFSNIEHVDKELHYVSEKSLSSFNYDKNKLNLTMMHHSIEWFHENIKNQLDFKIRDNTDVLFLGHEHDQHIDSFERDDNNLLISRVGEFNVEAYSDSTSFNSIFYDEQKNEVIFKIHNWNRARKIYLNQTKKRNNLCRKNGVPYSNEFTLKLIEDEKLSIGNSIEEYFVFPEIEYNKKNILDMNKLINIIKKNKYISISGTIDSGKTTLLKELYLTLKQEMFALYLDKGSIDKKNIKSIIKYAVNNQIDDQNSLDIYNQKPVDDRIVFVDDFDLIKDEKNQDYLIEYLKQYFGIIIFTNNTNSIVDIEETFKEKYALDISTVNINRFTIRQRTNLIDKIGKLFETDIKHDEPNSSIEVNLEHTPELKMLGNTFMIQFIYTSIRQGNLFSGTDKFDAMFEKILKDNIIANSNERNRNLYFIILQQLAMEMHKNRLNSVPDSYIAKIVETYNQEYGNKVNYIDFVKCMISSNILNKYDCNQYVFVNRLYLAYFVAKQICKEVNNDEDNTELNYVINNVCFGINGDILLFIIYMMQRTNLLFSINNQLKKITGQWPMFSFEKKNINFLMKKKNVSAIENIDDSDIKEAHDSAVEVEKEHMELVTYEYKGIYDYDEKDISKQVNQWTSALKLLELLARGLNSFCDELPVKDKSIIIDSIYQESNKLLFNILETVDSNFQNFVDVIIKNLKKDKEKSEDIVINYMLLFIDAFYYNICSMCASSNTMYAITEFYKKLPKTIDIQIFELELLSCSNKKTLFKSNLKSFLDEYKDIIVQSVIHILVIRYIFSNNMDSVERRQIINVFNKNSIANIKLSEKKIMIDAEKKKLNSKN